MDRMHSSGQRGAAASARARKGKRRIIDDDGTIRYAYVEASK